MLPTSPSRKVTCQLLTAALSLLTACLCAQQAPTPVHKKPLAPKPPLGFRSVWTEQTYAPGNPVTIAADDVLFLEYTAKR